jgi:fatty acid desaturase
MSDENGRSTMTRNMGKADKAIRTLIALVLVALVIAGQITGLWAVIALVVATAFVATSLVSFCPLYRLLGMNTCSKA